MHRHACFDPRVCPHPGFLEFLRRPHQHGVAGRVQRRQKGAFKLVQRQAREDPHLQHLSVQKENRAALVQRHLEHHEFLIHITDQACVVLAVNGAGNQQLDGLTDTQVHVGKARGLFKGKGGGHGCR